MPIQPFTYDLALRGTRQVVPPGNRINGFTVLAVTPGVLWYFKLGNNPQVGPISDASSLTLTFGGDYPASDVQEGMQIITDQDFPGATLVGFASMTARRP